MRDVDWQVLAQLLVLTIGFGWLAALEVRAPGNPDALLVFDAARSWPDLEVLDHRTLRPAVVLPTLVATWLVGPGELALRLVGFTSVAALVLATWWLGRRTATGWWGVVAGMVVLASPFLHPRLSEPSPDVIAAAATTCALAVLVGRDEPASSRRLALSGALLAVAALARVVVVPVVVVLAVAGRVRDRQRALALGVPLLVGGAVQALHDVVVSGSPFARLAALLRHDRAASFGPVGGDGNGLLDAVLGLPVALAQYEREPQWAVLLLAAVGLGVVVARWSRPARMLLGSVGLVWAVYVVTGGLLGDGATFVQGWVPRLWLPVWPAVVVLLPTALVALPGRLGAMARRAAVVAPVAVLALAVAVQASVVGWDLRGPALPDVRADLPTLRARLAAADAPDSIVTDERTAEVVPFAADDLFGRDQWDGDLVVHQPAGGLPAVEAALLDRHRPVPAARRLAEEVEAAGWERTWVSGDGGFELWRSGDG